MKSNRDKAKLIPKPEAELDLLEVVERELLMARWYVNVTLELLRREKARRIKRSLAQRLP